MTRERRLTAWHESGHAVCSWLVGDVPGLTSVRPSQRWCGVAFATRQHHDRDLLDDLDVSLPAPLWHPAVRRRFELEALVACAGPVAESLARRDEPPVLAGYVPPSPVERMLDQVTALTTKEEQQLAAGSADAPELETDTTKAYELALPPCRSARCACPVRASPNPGDRPSAAPSRAPSASRARRRAHPTRDTRRRGRAARARTS
jgi:hypothetical protein